MENEKISISLEEVNSERVDAEIHRQDIATRMAAHQEQIAAATPASSRFGGGFFRKAVVYMAFFGLVASLLGWGVGEIVQYRIDRHPWGQFQQAIAALRQLNPNPSDWEMERFFETLQNSESGKYRDNPFFRKSFWNKPSEVIDLELEAGEKSYRNLDRIWFMLIALFIGVGLSVAEPWVGRNASSAAIRGVLGAVLGALGGFIVSLFINEIYHSLGGGSDDSSFVQQMFARGIGWSILGAFLAIAPGIVMANAKKFFLGLAGGAIGGLVGGMLFDPICALTGSDVPARFVNIVGLGVGAAVATALLEEAAKQGWLKVATGVITGKQFILYRNPTVIGSSPKTEIYLFKDPTVAPKHAAINGMGGEFVLTALNGATVLLNGVPVKQQRLKNGDQIRVGNTIFLFGARAIRH